MLKEERGKKLKYALVWLFLLMAGLFLFNNRVFAADALTADSAAAIEAHNSNSLLMVVNIVLGILALADIGFIIYAGWMWKESEGDEEVIDKAKKILIFAGIGLVIIIIAFILANMFLSKLVPNAGGGGGVATKTKPQHYFSEAGNMSIEYHYPVMNQKNVARNTRISITFREAIDKNSIIRDGKVNANNVFIYRTANGSKSGNLTSVIAEVTSDGKTVVLSPEEKLGSPTEPVWYTVALSRDIRKANNDPLFPNVDGDIGYFWSFEVGVSDDTVPARVESVLPAPSTTESKNIVIQVNFDKPINPMTLSGAVKDGFDNMTVKDIVASNTSITGNFYVSNLYQTVEFVPDDVCGQNNCGQAIYCLPSKGLISVLLRAASLADQTNKDSSSAKYPYDGVADINGNSLDGNRNNKAQGPQGQSGLAPFNYNAPASANPGDDFVWSFYTNNSIDNKGVIIKSIRPNINEYGIGLDSVPEAGFNRYIMFSSLIKSNVPMFIKPAESEVFYWLTATNATTSNGSIAKIRHEQFYSQSDYTPEFDSGVMDIYQNCLSPATGPVCNPDIDGGKPYCCNGQQSAGNCHNQ